MVVKYLWCYPGIIPSCRENPSQNSRFVTRIRAATQINKQVHDINYTLILTVCYRSVSVTYENTTLQRSVST
jgi:hypothetical protein